MGIDLISLNKKIQEEMAKLGENLNIFAKMQRETEGVKAVYLKAEADLKRLENDNRDTIKSFEQQMADIILKINDEIKAHREFIGECNKRLEEQKSAILHEAFTEADKKIQIEIAGLNKEINVLNKKINKANRNFIISLAAAAVSMLIAAGAYIIN